MCKCPSNKDPTNSYSHRQISELQKDIRRLTQMSHPSQPRVEAHLLDLVGARQEEVDHPVCHHAVGETLDGVVEAPAYVQTVPLLSALLQGEGLPVGGRVARHFPHCTADLREGGMGWGREGPWVMSALHLYLCLCAEGNSHWRPLHQISGPSNYIQMDIHKQTFTGEK